MTKPIVSFRNFANASNSSSITVQNRERESHATGDRKMH